MLNTLEKLCRLNGASGAETAVANYILNEISGFCEAKTDNLGNIIAFKKGKKTPKQKIMLDAHTDEVGVIITAILPDGFLKFGSLGGIKESVLLGRKVVFENGTVGIIGFKPIHLTSPDERKKLPTEENLYIDIGAKNKQEAESKVFLGETGVMEGAFVKMGENIKSKALDDRVGCAVLIDLIKSYDEYDFYATFTVQEEIGCRGAKAAAYAVNPDVCIVLEATTANDIAGVADDKKVCCLGQGAAVSFMDRSTFYDRALYNKALSSKIKVQSKAAVAGGNNSGAIHLSREGIRTVALSLPCRYIHTPACMANSGDIMALRALAEFMINAACEEE